MVREGVNHVIHHPAPNHKPWIIMDKADQEGFKQALLAYDPVLDIHANEVAAAAEKGDWFEAAAAASRLQTACVSCHSQWRRKALREPTVCHPDDFQTQLIPLPQFWTRLP